jgi:biopolymer transport protein ExbD
MKVPREESNEEVFLNLTAFIDMMLVLVIFFLATSRFTEDERDESIRLAKSGSTLPIPTLSDVLVVNIDREGRRKIDGTIRTLEEVEAVIRERKGAREDLEVVARADVRGPVLALAEVFEICHRLGLKTPNFAYETFSD